MAEHVQAKWTPVRRPDMRPSKKLTWLFENLDMEDVRDERTTASVVMRGLDPRIHPGFRERWMAGSSPAMTTERLLALRTLLPRVHGNRGEGAMRDGFGERGLLACFKH